MGRGVIFATRFIVFVRRIVIALRSTATLTVGGIVVFAIHALFAALAKDHARQLVDPRILALAGRPYTRGDREIPASTLAVLLEKYGVDPFWMIAGDQPGMILKEASMVLGEIRRIYENVEEREAAIGMSLTADERWRAVSQIYTQIMWNKCKYNDMAQPGTPVIDTTIGNVRHG